MHCEQHILEDRRDPEKLEITPEKTEKNGGNCLEGKPKYFSCLFDFKKKG